MATFSQDAQRALDQLSEGGSGHDARVSPAFVRRIRRAAKLLESVAATTSDATAEALVANAILQLMRALGEQDARDIHPVAPVVVAATRALDILKTVRPAGDEGMARAAPAPAVIDGGTKILPTLQDRQPEQPPISPAEPPPVPLPVIPAGRPQLQSHKGPLVQASLEAHLATLYRRRAFLLGDIGLRWRDLDHVDARIERELLALGWLHAEGGAIDQDALWFAPQERLREIIASLPVPGAPAATRVWAARLALAEGIPVAPSTLVALTDDPSDEIANAAARLLAHTAPSREALEAVLDRFRRASTQTRADALICAAVAMGAPQALEEVRRRAANGPVSEQLVLALAMGGSARDAELLVQVAASGGAEANLAAIAVGHLGYPQAVTALPGTIEPRVREHALALVFGAEEADPSLRSRIIHGKPWSVRRALDGADDPEQWVIVRALRAWELAARPGAAVTLRRYELHAPASSQAKAVAALRARLCATDDVA